MFVDVLLVCLIFRILNVTVCQDIDTYEKLYNDLFNNQYNPDLKPVSNVTMTITIAFFNLGLNHFDEVDGILSVSGGLEISWFDNSLKWNPKDYNGISEMLVSKSVIWFPHLTLMTDAQQLQPFGANSLFKILIRHDGFIYWTPADIINSKCAANIRKFPYDEQECSILFMAWDITWKTHLQAASVPYIDYYENKHPDWNTKGVISRQGKIFGNTSHEFVFKIKREPLYYNILVFLPVSLLSLLNPLVFLLPHECGERLGYGITILLSFVIFLTLASDKIPATSNPISFLIVFIIMVFVASAVITFLNIINAYLFYKSDYELKGFFKDMYVIFKKRRKNQVIPEEKCKINYKDIAIGLDRFCFVLSYIAMLTFITVYFIVLQY
ncbi:unnamed protein product [Mytilus coruscus]|uniref:CHRNN n=1 Tax=Mytilus coruscus TaxID=42192 RepID=A0A6J8EG35_MYTCO|nr:unnamed protein product [Mytilus coruscus]